MGNCRPCRALPQILIRPTISMHLQTVAANPLAFQSIHAPTCTQGLLHQQTALRQTVDCGVQARGAATCAPMRSGPTSIASGRSPPWSGAQRCAPLHPLLPRPIGMQRPAAGTMTGSSAPVLPSGVSGSPAAHGGVKHRGVGGAPRPVHSPEVGAWGGAGVPRDEEDGDHRL